jgi:hypothetical protein
VKNAVSLFFSRSSSKTFMVTERNGLESNFMICFNTCYNYTIKTVSWNSNAKSDLLICKRAIKDFECLSITKMSFTFPLHDFMLHEETIEVGIIFFCKLNPAKQ